jgi:hypothetical protein
VNEEKLNKFFDLSEPYATESGHLYADIGYIGPEPEKKIIEAFDATKYKYTWWEFACARGVIDPPVVPMPFKNYNAGRIRDFHEVKLVVVAVISDKLKKLLEENQVTGYTVVPATIVRGKKLYTNYWGMRVHSKCGHIQPDRSRKEKVSIFDKYTQKETYKYAKVGLYFDVNTWDGSDFFLPTLKDDDYFITSIFCTEKIKQLFVSNKIENCKFTPVLEYIWSDSLL